MTHRRRRDPPVQPAHPDVEPSSGATASERVPGLIAVLPVIALGGVIGAIARYQVGRWWPTPAGGFPAATLAINLLGCLLIGAFIVAITEWGIPHPLLRPFFGTGVLGGFTTFSTYALDVHTLILGRHAGLAMGYLTATAGGSVLAAAAGMSLVRRARGRERGR